MLAGRWQYHEETLRKKTWETLQILHDALLELISFEIDEFGAEVHVMSVDCVNFVIEEPRTDPGPKWFDQKSYSAGLKYEFALPLYLQRVSRSFSFFGFSMH